MNMKRKKIIVACHDAGGAELIAAYIVHRQSSDVFICFVSGPAVAVFERHKIVAHIYSGESIISLLRPHVDASYVLTGNSWASSFETDFRFAAKKIGLKTVVCLDYWLRCRERFGYPRRAWQQYLPDEIWIGYPLPRRDAQLFFPKTPVRIIPNFYLREGVAEVRRYEHFRTGSTHSRISRGRGTVLVVCIPLNAPRNHFGDPVRLIADEFQLLDYILCTLQRLVPEWRVIVRQHPSEKEDKYEDVVAPHRRRLDITYSDARRPLASDIAESTLVIGPASTALVLAKLSHRSVVGIFPWMYERSWFPFDIPYVRKLAQLSAVIKKFV